MRRQCALEGFASARDGVTLEVRSTAGSVENKQLLAGDDADHYIRVDRVRYSDGTNHDDFDSGIDLWPVEADGTGKSLTRNNPPAYGNVPNDWTAATPTPAW